MAKLTLEDLRKLRGEKKQEMDMRDTANKVIQVIVGMGTSGIAAGAKDTLKAFTDELNKYGLTNVALRQTGSIGLDHAEPVVEVKMPGMPDTIYGRVDAKVARQIVEQHIIGKQLVNEHVFDRPAADIMSE
jgi:NADP-reducing hydrogenase subunit HndB